MNNALKVLPLIMLSIPVVAEADITGKIVRVLDGDTVEILAGNVATRVRLNGIDAPEKAQPFGQRSRQALTAIVGGKTVLAVGEKRDRYGRLLATLILDGRDINATQVYSGMAWVYRYKGLATEPEYLRYERDARTARRGLWSEKEPVEPSIWRQRHR
ncbi:nuclease [Salmonella enterica subsp. enterica serovar Enteritidis]|uniref:ParB n=2 Tax=Enterobacter cloacae TaxID=550 RepID=A0A0H3CWT9_ENTCC|nr:MULTISPECIES: thermonuclease family protein [Enterobacteriaceae]EAO4330409.1 nuclease [Salmonella enterica]EBV4663559.1 nuclease [Salmonella enterica subsp. enterica serovar Typhimurium]EBZ3089634.1 nuclease [Salmonella enterica subsp. enterica serovar Enteritidis]ECG6671120.1 nuclease [Salmonella enterica subsp. enterica serovar Weltevreden]EDF3626282.1 nuclease [Salmonella enterica subsp. enterica serovar Newport]EGI5202494.1 thermonuclease family protein [Salmonella enterica subsp. ente